MPPLIKDQTADTGKYKYSYADLPTVLDLTLKPLRDVGLTIVQAPDFDGNSLLLTTVIANAGGAWLSNTFRLPCGGRDAQAVGSAITYSRRYALVALLSLAADDDDGKAAMPQTVTNKAKQAAHEAVPGKLKSGSDIAPPNPAKAKLLKILKEEIKCPLSRGLELFDAATGGKFLPVDIDDPEKAKEILVLFEREAKNLPYVKWMDEIVQLKIAAGGNALDDFAKDAI